MSNADIRGRFIWHELMTTDTDAAGAFYSKVMPWKTQPSGMPGYTLWFAGKTQAGGLMALPGRRAPVPHWLTYIGTPSVDSTLEGVQRLGGKVFKGASDIPNVGRYAVVADPQGAAFALYTPGPRLGGRRGCGRAAPGELLLARAGDDGRGCRASSFYTELFGWEKGPGHDMGGDVGIYQLITQGGQQIGGMYKSSERLGTAELADLRHVADIDKAANAVKGGGGRVLNGPMEVPGRQLDRSGDGPAGWHVRGDRGRPRWRPPAAPRNPRKHPSAAERNPPRRSRRRADRGSRSRRGRRRQSRAAAKPAAKPAAKAGRGEEGRCAKKAAAGRPRKKAAKKEGSARKPRQESGQEGCRQARGRRREAGARRGKRREEERPSAAKARKGKCAEVLIRGFIGDEAASPAATATSPSAASRRSVPRPVASPRPPAVARGLGFLGLLCLFRRPRSAAVAPAAPTSASPQPASSNAAGEDRASLVQRSRPARRVGTAPAIYRRCGIPASRSDARTRFRKPTRALLLAPAARRKAVCCGRARCRIHAGRASALRRMVHSSMAKIGVSMAKASMTNKIPAEQPRVRRGYFECRYGQLHVHNAIPPGGRLRRGHFAAVPAPTPLSGRLFERFLALAGHDRSVYAPDIPGFGDSDAPTSRPTIVDYAGAIGDFLDSMRFRQIDVLGYQMGALIAAELAIARPKQIRRVVLVSVPALNDTDRESFRQAQAPSAAVSDGSHLMSEWQRVRDSYGPGVPPEVAANAFAEQAAQRYPRRLGRQRDSPVRRAGAARARDPTEPGAAAQRHFWEATQRVRELLPKARLMDLPGAGAGIVRALTRDGRRSDEGFPARLSAAGEAAAAASGTVPRTRGCAGLCQSSMNPSHTFACHGSATRSRWR